MRYSVDGNQINASKMKQRVSGIQEKNVYTNKEVTDHHLRVDKIKV